MIKKYLEFIKEGKQEKEYNTKNLVEEICVSMVLLNNEFLDNLLDKGNKARYQENSNVFITDLKNIILSKSRLRLGKIEDGKAVEDKEISKINNIFNTIEFSLEEDWNKLINSRLTARNIIDKLVPDEKLSPERIEKIFLLGPNKNEDYQEDVIIELTDGKQYSIFLNKNLSMQKSASFNKFADDLIGNDLDKLYNDENIRKWNKLTQEWIRIIYENSNKNIQQHIEKFIDSKRIDSIGFFEFFDIKHRDPKFKFLGEYIKEFEKNILKLSDLLNEIWKNKESCFQDFVRVEKEWTEIKIIILNSRILEHLLTTSLKENKPDDIETLSDGLKLANGSVKMKFIKTIVEKIDCLERPIYYLSDNGNNFYQIPNRDFFRKYYDNMEVHFDYHVKFEIDEEDDNNDFNIKVKLLLDSQEILKMNIIVKFSGGEFSSKLTAKYKFELPANFNYLISKKETEEAE